MVKKVAILANGGDVSGFNAVIRAIVKTAEQNEMYEMLTGNTDLAYRTWPKADESKLKVEEKEIAVQVNGKVRGKFTIGADASDDEIYETT